MRSARKVRRPGSRRCRSPAKDAGNPLFTADLSERDMDNEIRVSGGIVDFGADEYHAAITIYTFTGNGNWSEPSNWMNGLMPPAVLMGNTRIIIEPGNDGECILNIEQHIGGGAYLIVQPNKKFTIAGKISINN